MLAAQLFGARDIRLAQVAEPEPAAGEIVVSVAACGICGSDLHAFRSPTVAHPGRVLGHEFSGTVLSALSVPGIAVGDRVAVRPLIACGVCPQCASGSTHLCVRGANGIIGYGYDGAFAERVLVPAARRGETVFVLPSTVDDRAGALIEPLGVGLRAAKQAGEVSGATVLVLGAGMIGLAVTQFLRLRGAGAVIVADPSARRRDAATLLGAQTVLDPRTTPLSKPIDGLVDAVIDCSGAADALTEGLRAVRAAGTVVLCAVYGKKVPISLDRVVGQELTVKGSFAYQAEFPEAIAAVAAGHIDPSAFVSHELPLAEIEKAFLTQLDAHSSLKVLVRPNGE
jgi:2-desacetyl-2-hydroxyethyl bacteriochlorophyllide A dehydrogenase